MAVRLFIPLKEQAYAAFAQRRKTWELRLRRRQWTERNIWPGRRVELRRGYSTPDSLWGHIVAIESAQRLHELFDAIDYVSAVPYAAGRAEAIKIVAGTLVTADAPVIAFRVELDAYPTASSIPELYSSVCSA